MAHLYKAIEWESAGSWYVNDITEPETGACYWWIPANILGLSPVDYVLMLKNTFKVKKVSYNIEKNVLIFSFNSQTDARKYKNYINKIAREKNFVCK